MHAYFAQHWSRVAEVAGRRHGLVTFEQLIECGLGRGAIQHGVRSARLHRVHHGVFLVGHPAMTDHGRWMAAVLACGSDSALSHRSAATLRRLRSGEGPRIDVTVPTRNGRSRPGVRVHRAVLSPGDVEIVDGIRVTSVARTIADLAHELDEDELRGVVREAQFLRQFDLERTRRAAARRPSRALNDILEEMLGSSRLNDDFLRLLRRHRLPLPMPEKLLLGHRVDFVWEAQRVAVELDGYRAHVSLDAFQRDRSQGNALQVAGWSLLRFTWADVHRRGTRTAATLRRVLGEEDMS